MPEAPGRPFWFRGEEVLESVSRFFFLFKRGCGVYARAERRRAAAAVKGCGTAM